MTFKCFSFKFNLRILNKINKRVILFMKLMEYEKMRQKQCLANYHLHPAKHKNTEFFISESELQLMVIIFRKLQCIIIKLLINIVTLNNLF